VSKTYGWWAGYDYGRRWEDGVRVVWVINSAHCLMDALVNCFSTVLRWNST